MFLPLLFPSPSKKIEERKKRKDSTKDDRLCFLLSSTYKISMPGFLEIKKKKILHRTFSENIILSKFH